jgi:hypothetical protein
MDFLLLFIKENLPVFYNMYNKQIVNKNHHYIYCCNVKRFVLLWIKHLQTYCHFHLDSPRRRKRETFDF